MILDFFSSWSVVGYAFFSYRELVGLVWLFWWEKKWMKSVEGCSLMFIEGLLMMLSSLSAQSNPFSYIFLGIGLRYM